MTNIPLSIAVCASALAGSVVISLIVGQCALYQITNICPLH